MTPVLLVVGVSASEAVAELWRLVSRGPISYPRLLARMAGEAALRGVALSAWITVTTTVAFALAPGELAWTALWSSVAFGLTPLLFAGIGIAPHIGPMLYLLLHGWTIFRLGTRIQATTGLSMLEGAFAVLVGAGSYWLCRTLRSWPERRRRIRRRPGSLVTGGPR